MTGQTQPQTVKHTIKWFVWAGGYGQPLEKLPHTAQMRGSWTGWDAECSCGAGSHTGGAIKARISEWVWDHKREIEQNAEIAAAGYDPSDARQVIDYYKTVKGYDPVTGTFADDRN